MQMLGVENQQGPGLREHLIVGQALVFLFPSKCGRTQCLSQWKMLPCSTLRRFCLFSGLFSDVPQTKLKPGPRQERLLLRLELSDDLASEGSEGAHQAHPPEEDHEGQRQGQDGHSGGTL